MKFLLSTATLIGVTATSVFASSSAPNSVLSTIKKSYQRTQGVVALTKCPELETPPLAFKLDPKIYDQMVAKACGTGKNAKPFFIRIDRLTPGQTLFSEQGVKDTKNIPRIHKEKRDSEGKLEFEGKFDNGYSVFAMNDKPVPVIRAPFGFVVQDEHHSVFASIRMGAKTIPVKIVKDMQHYDNNDAFWDALKKQNLAFLYDKDGNPVDPKYTFQDVLYHPKKYDDKIRYFVKKAHFNCKFKDGMLDEKESKGFAKPIGIKIDKGQPFYELIVARALRAGGFKMTEVDEKGLADKTTLNQTVERLLPSAVEALAKQAAQTALNDFNFPYDKLAQQGEEGKDYKDLAAYNKYCLKQLLIKNTALNNSDF